MGPPGFSSATQGALTGFDDSTDQWIDVLSRLAQAPSPNPPGDTRPAAAVAIDILESAGIEHEVYARERHLPNIVASIDFGPGRHLVLNGHLDTFPVGSQEAWAFDPFGGEVTDSRLYGRGVVDMKAGVAAALATMCHAATSGAGAGRLTLTLVSDEETGGSLGTGFLLDAAGDAVKGDAVLNGEPTGLELIRVGEKALYWVAIDVQTTGGHGAYPHLAHNANIAALELFTTIAAECSALMNDENIARTLLKEPAARSAYDAVLGSGASRAVESVTVTLGIISGGNKVNLASSGCHLELDIRVPPGMTIDTVRRLVHDKVEHTPFTELTEMHDEITEPNSSDPRHELVLGLSNCAEALGLSRPFPVISLGGTDCRFWRARGIPAYSYGPSPKMMGVVDEYVELSEFLAMCRVHLASALEFLSPPDQLKGVVQHESP